MVGGGGTDFGTFHCENISVVNGAQTVSTIGRYYAKFPKKMELACVLLRIISLENADEHLENSITKNNNRQNRIENRDFVTLDAEQSRLRAEIGVEGIIYHVIRSESISKTDKSFDLVEATTALACASGKPNLFVQLKREIGKLWEDISRSPYKELFNPSVKSFYLWRAVQIQRIIDKSIEEIVKLEGQTGRELSLFIHGNRMISALVFCSLSPERFENPTFDFAKEVTQAQIQAIVKEVYIKLSTELEFSYPNSIIPTLFKNLSKCTALFSKILQAGSV